MFKFHKDMYNKTLNPIWLEIMKTCILSSSGKTYGNLLWLGSCLEWLRNQGYE